MEGLSMLVQGLINHFEPKMLFLMSVASILGITIGALPGLTATMGIALLSSITYGMDPKLAIPILVALYCGGIYGGSNSAVLLNIPGTPSAAATAIDGYQLAQKGEAGPAMGLARVASTVGGLIGVVALVLATPLLAKLALKFGSWEFFVISVMGIMVCGSLTIGELPVKGWMTGFLGLLTAMIGMDVITSYQRFTFGNLHLNSGVSLIPALIGLFGMTEILTVMREPIQGELAVDPKELKVSIPFGELLKYWATTIRSALIGIAIGIIPGVGEDVAAWVSYGTAKNVGAEKDKIGYGSKEGVVAAEVANNACIGGASIPMLALAIPGSGAAAVLLGGIWLHGIRPGPLIFIESPQFFYDYVGMQIISNIMILVFGLAISNVLIKVLLVKKDILMPVVATLCVVGAFAVNNSVFDVYLMLIFGLVGYLLRNHGYPMAPYTLGLILGTMADENLRRGLDLTKGDITPFFFRPITAILWLIILAMVVARSPYLMGLLRRLLGRQKAKTA